MAVRYPESKYVGVACLPGYRWQINTRGYAIIASVCPTDEVYALAYRPAARDEERLDINEGVPFAYNKENMSVELWPAQGEDWFNVTDGHKARKRETYLYIDRNNTRDSKRKKEYIYRKNMGIKDSIAKGIPQEYVDNVVRKFIPELKILW